MESPYSNISCLGQAVGATLAVARFWSFFFYLLGVTHFRLQFGDSSGIEMNRRTMDSPPLAGELEGVGTETLSVQLRKS